MAVSVSQADVAFDGLFTSITYDVERGETPEYPVMSVYDRPIRPKLSKLLKPGFNEDRSSYNITEISQVIVGQADLDFELPNGVFGIWGALQQYDKSGMSAYIAFSYDDFQTISGYAKGEVEYKASSGVPPEVPYGTDDPKAGTRTAYSYRIEPSQGYTMEGTVDVSLGRFQEVNLQYGRIRARVLNAYGEPIPGEKVQLVQTGDFFTTDSWGYVYLDLPEQTWDVSALRGDITKTVSVKKFELVDVEFQYAGVSGTATDVNGLPIPGTVITIEEVGGEEKITVLSDGFGNFEYPMLKPTKKYKITILNYWKEYQMLGEGYVANVLFKQAEGWDSPSGYPTTPQNATIIVVDEEGNPLYGIPVIIYDDVLKFSVKTNLSGNAVLVVPAMKWKLLIDGKDRYNSVEKEIDLSTVPYSEKVVLVRKVAISVR